MSTSPATRSGKVPPTAPFQGETVTVAPTSTTIEL